MSVKKSRSRVANAVKQSRADGLDPDSAPIVREARRDLAADKLGAYIARTVAEAPPLSAQQREFLVGLISEGRRG